VAVFQAKVRIGPDGTFRIRALPEGRYRLRAEAPDGRAAGIDLVLGSAPPPAVTLVLAPGAAIRGRVVSRDTGRPLPGAVVRLRTAGRAEGVVPPATAGPGGEFLLRGVPPGAHDLLATAAGHAPLWVRDLLVSDTGAGVDAGDLALPAGALLRVRVYDEGRLPVAGQTVAVEDAAGLHREAATGEGGEAIFEGLPAGPHDVVLALAGGRVLRRAVEVPSDGEVEEVFDEAMTRPGTLTVRRGPEPVAGAWVRVFFREGGGRGTATTAAESPTDAAGEARLPALPEGPLLAEVTPPGEPAVRVGAVVRAHRAEVTLPLDAVAGIAVAEEDGRPVAGVSALLSLRTPGPGPVAGALDEQGSEAAGDAAGAFRFPSVPPGVYRLEVRAPGRGTARTEVTVRAGSGETPVRVLLRREARVRGTVLSPGRVPVPGALVEATDLLTGALLPGARTRSGADGSFDLAGLAPGVFVLTVRAPGVGSSAPERVNVAAGEVRRVEVTLDAGGTLEVRTVGLRGVPVPDARVTVTDALGNPVLLSGPEAFPGGGLQRPGRTDVDGVLRLPGLRAGIYVVRAEAPGLLPAEVRVRVDPRDGARAVLALLAAGDVRR